ncbi:hypothetical protein ACFXP3_31985, partial [Streptomyces sp. NPDC059096]|uniref:hypothetical protein n=1 Tax=Streptomyces sp. NPDC059096 TaxID=3346727 RepID=UPI003684E94C
MRLARAAVGAQPAQCGDGLDGGALVLRRGGGRRFARGCDGRAAEPGAARGVGRGGWRRRGLGVGRRLLGLQDLVDPVDLEPGEEGP